MLRTQKKAAEMREFLIKIYNESGRAEALADFSDEEILDLAHNLREGVPFATPVFDGATEGEMDARAGSGVPGRHREAAGHDEVEESGAVERRPHG
jgi:DNA-directed RNA polymerase subunit beta